MLKKQKYARTVLDIPEFLSKKKAGLGQLYVQVNIRKGVAL